VTPGAPNILIVRFSSIGDLLLTTPLLRALRTRHPEARITCVLREDMADTLRHNPRIDRLITWRHGTPLSALGRQLREEPWTHRLDLHGSLRSHALRRLVGGRWTGYPKHRLRRALLIRTHRARGGDLGPVAERYFAAARDLDVFPDGGPAEFFTTPEADREAAAFLTTHRLGELRPIVAVAPGAAHFTKRWPAAHWEALAARLPATHDLLVLGGPAERELGERIVAAAGRGASAAGQFSLIGSGALLKRAAALVAGDTGVLHLATAVGTPAVALYGPTVREFGFFPYHAQAVVVERDLRCRPCTAHGGPACPLGHLHCLVQIEPTAVLTALEALGR
jgi:heptosyltransferase-2